MVPSLNMLVVMYELSRFAGICWFMDCLCSSDLQPVSKGGCRSAWGERLVGSADIAYTQ